MSKVTFVPPVPTVGGAPILRRQAEVSTPTFVITSNTYVPIDLTAASATGTLPASPSDKDQVRVKIVKQGSVTYTATTNAAGGKTFNTPSGPTAFTLTTLNETATFQYDATSGTWTVIEHGYSKESLDGRYSPCVVASGPGIDPTFATDSYAGLMAKATEALAKGLPLCIPPGHYKTSAELRVNSASFRCYGFGPAATIIEAASSGYNVWNIGPTSTGHVVNPNGWLKDMAVKGAGRPGTPDYKACVTLNGAIQFKVENVTADAADIGFDLINNCYGSYFENLRAGFGGTLNVGVRLRTGLQSGDDIIFNVPWISGEHAAVQIESNGSDGTSGFVFNQGQYSCNQLGSSDDTTIGAFIIGKNYQDGTSTGEVRQVIVNGGDFEAVFHCYDFKLYVPTTLVLNGTRFDGNGSGGTSGNAHLGILSHASPYDDCISLNNIAIAGHCRYKLFDYTANSGSSATLTEIGTHGKPIMNSFLTTTGTASIGSAVTVAVSALVNFIPIGTAITFSGTGVLTLTKDALPGATSLIGNLTTANIASGETSTVQVSTSLYTRGIFDLQGTAKGIALKGGNKPILYMDGTRFQTNAGDLLTSTDGVTYKTGLKGKRCRLWLSGTQTIASGNARMNLTNGDTNDDATLFTSYTSADGTHPSQIQVLKDGLYQIQYDVDIQATSAGQVQLIIQRNLDNNTSRGGTQYVYHPGGSVSYRYNGVTNVRLTANDYIDLLIAVSSSTVVNGAGVPNCGLALVYLGN